jgi:hypothetical protein
MRLLAKTAGIIVAVVTTAALAGLSGSEAVAATSARAADTSGDQLVKLAGTISYKESSTPEDWTGTDKQTATFVPTGDFTGGWEVEDNTDESMSLGECKETLKGTFGGSGTFNDSQGDDFIALDYDPIKGGGPQYLTIELGFDETYTRTYSGPPDCEQGSQTYTSTNYIIPACYAQGDPELKGSASGAFPDDATISFDCSGSDSSDFINSYAASGQLHMACPAKSEMGRRIDCIAEAAQFGWPLGSWVDDQVPYSWGGGHKKSPGPTLGTCEGYAGPDKDHCDTYTKGPRFTVGLDCSGFTRWVYYLAYGKDVLGDGENNSQREHPGVTEVDKPSLGDLVFYGPDGSTHHTAIYIGPIYYLLEELAGGGDNVANEYATLHYVQFNTVKSLVSRN